MVSYAIYSENTVKYSPTMRSVPPIEELFANMDLTKHTDLVNYYYSAAPKSC
jgi:hypothetical protein